MLASYADVHRQATLMPDEDKTFNGSLVLDVRIGWRHVHTLYTYAIKPLLQVHGEEKLLLPGTFS